MAEKPLEGVTKEVHEHYEKAEDQVLPEEKLYQVLEAKKEVREDIVKNLARSKLEKLQQDIGVHRLNNVMRDEYDVFLADELQERIGTKLKEPEKPSERIGRYIDEGKQFFNDSWQEVKNFYNEPKKTFSKAIDFAVGTGSKILEKGVKLWHKLIGWLKESFGKMEGGTRSALASVVGFFAGDKAKEFIEGTSAALQGSVEGALKSIEKYLPGPLQRGPEDEKIWARIEREYRVFLTKKEFVVLKQKYTDVNTFVQEAIEEGRGKLVSSLGKYTLETVQKAVTDFVSNTTARKKEASETAPPTPAVPPVAPSGGPPASGAAPRP